MRRIGRVLLGGMLSAAALSGGEATLFAKIAMGKSVLTGIDVLQTQGFKPLRGKKIGLVTNLAALNREGVPTLDVLLRAPKVTVAAVFSPEHGLTVKAAEGATVSSGEDKNRGMKVYSLYGDQTKPSPAQLKGLDLLVVDLPDVGTRFYTYPSTAALCMEAAAQAKIPVLVLDRPNPLNGLSVEGPVLKPADYSFTGYSSVPIRHGLTLGELAEFMNAEKKIGADLKVVKVKGWKRGMWFDETGLPWVNPSPNLRNLTQVILYPCVCLLEPTNLSVGRGTDKPFETFGAPWISPQDAKKLAEAMNAKHLPGVRFYPLHFTPKDNVFEKTACGGCRLELTDRNAFKPVRTGLSLMGEMARLFGKKFEMEKSDRLLRAVEIRKALQKGVPDAEVTGMYREEEAAFKKLRKKYLLY